MPSRLRDDSIPAWIAPAEEITDPERAEALGLTVDARRMRSHTRTWRAFIGEWPGDHRTVLHTYGLTWREARDVLLAFADEALELNVGDDGCPHCYEAAWVAVHELAELSEGTEWSGDIDWDELRLIRESAHLKLP